MFKKGIKISVKRGTKGTISLTGFVENFSLDNENQIEEINTETKKEVVT